MRWRYSVNDDGFIPNSFEWSESLLGRFDSEASAAAEAARRVKHESGTVRISLWRGREFRGTFDVDVKVVFQCEAKPVYSELVYCNMEDGSGPFDVLGVQAHFERHMNSSDEFWYKEFGRFDGCDELFPTNRVLSLEQCDGCLVQSFKDDEVDEG